MLAEGTNHPANAVLAREGDEDDTRQSAPGVVGGADRGALEIDGILAVAGDATELLALFEGQVTDSQDPATEIALPRKVVPVQRSADYTSRSASSYESGAHPRLEVEGVARPEGERFADQQGAEPRLHRPGGEGSPGAGNPGRWVVHRITRSGASDR